MRDGPGSGTDLIGTDWSRPHYIFHSRNIAYRQYACHVLRLSSDLDSCIDGNVSFPIPPTEQIGNRTSKESSWNDTDHGIANSHDHGV